MEYILTRVSGKKQTVKNQRYVCTQDVLNRNPNAQIVYLDEPDTSSRKHYTKRLKLMELLEITKKDDIVTVYSLDRFARRPVEMQTVYTTLIDKGVIVRSILQPLVDEGQVGIWGMVAFQERKFISERTKTALSYRKSIGQRHGKAPYGFCLKQLPDERLMSLHPESSEMDVIRLCLSLRKAGNSVYTIVNHLDNLGYKNRVGKSFHPVSVERILKKSADPMYRDQLHVH